MTLDTATAQQRTLTPSQLEVVQRVWQIAGWVPVTGYGTLALSATVADNGPLAETLTAVDFDDVSSVAHAVEALRRSRERMWK